ncbi:hypothetical protein WJX74_009225 [Apatococcus lobatus]|uniref:Uncharacterized protein n=1 Tax=Apatococcus lobatus TaxID=904363 RepID=A0AAW1SCJ7_9CHLO
MPQQPVHDLGKRSFQDEPPVPEPEPPTLSDVPAGMWGADYQGETGGAYPRTPQPSMAMASLSAGLSQSFGRDTTISEEAEGAPQALPGHLPPIQSDTPTTALSLEPASPETKGPHQSAAGPIVNGSAPEGSIPTEPVQTPRAAGTLKRYTSDIGGGDGLAELASSIDQSRQQLLKRYTSDNVDANGMAELATSMQHDRQQAAGSPDAPQSSSAGPLHGSDGDSTGPGAGSREMRRVISDIGGSEGLAGFAKSLQPVPEAEPVTPESTSQKEAPVSHAKSTLSTEHDGPIPRLDLEQLPEAATNTLSTTSRQPATTKPLPDASHEDATDAIAEGFGLPNSARDLARPPSEAASDAFTDMPQGISAGKSEHQEPNAKPAVSSLYERILAQQQASGAARRKSSSGVADSTLQKRVPDPSDWARPAPTPAGGASHLKGVPDPSDWQLGMPHPDADNRHEKGVPDPSDWGRERSTPAGGEAHSRGVPDPSGWQREAPTSHPAQAQNDAMVAEQHDAALQTASHDTAASSSREGSPRGVKEEAPAANNKGGHKYSYLQQIGVIGKGPPPLTVDPGRGRQQLRPSPRRPSLQGEAGTNAGWSPRSSGNTNFGVKLRPVSKSPPKSASARPTLDHHRSTSPPMNISPRRSQDIIASRPRQSSSNTSSVRTTREFRSSGQSPLRSRPTSARPSNDRPTSARPALRPPPERPVPSQVEAEEGRTRSARPSRASRDVYLSDEDIMLKRLVSDPARLHQQHQGMEQGSGNSGQDSSHGAAEMPMTMARQTILKQEQPTVPMAEAKQSILKQELQSELRGTLEGRRVPSLPFPNDSSEAASGAHEEIKNADGNGADAEVPTVKRQSSTASKIELPAILLRKTTSIKRPGSASRLAASSSSQDPLPAEPASEHRRGQATNTSPYRSRTVASRRADDMPLKSFVPKQSPSQFAGSNKPGGTRAVKPPVRPGSAAFGSGAGHK